MNIVCTYRGKSEDAGMVMLMSRGLLDTVMFISWNRWYFFDAARIAESCVDSENCRFRYYRWKELQGRVVPVQNDEVFSGCDCYRPLMHIALRGTIRKLRG